MYVLFFKSKIKAQCKNKPNVDLHSVPSAVRTQCALASVFSSVVCRKQCLPAWCGWSRIGNNMCKLPSPRSGTCKVLSKNGNDSKAANVHPEIVYRKESP